MSLKFKVPGKTFLAGEYLVLHEGPALVLLTEPRFELRVTRGLGGLGDIHVDSPAGQLFKKYEKDFEGYQFNFVDPYNGKGGFGASTAQFLSLYSFRLLRDRAQQDMEKLIDYKDLLETYYTCAWSGEGVRPSGADLIGQLKGALTFFEKQKGLINVKSWPFDDIEAHLIHTGNKIATHEHLKNLPTFESNALQKSFEVIREAIGIGQSENFVRGIHAYAEALRNLNFTCVETLELLGEIRSLNGVLAAKGCGALGADVILVITKTDATSALINFCERYNLSVITNSKNISAGLKMEGSL